jgi:hypothetical protein
MKTTVRRAIGRQLARAGTACVLAGSAGALMSAGASHAATKAMPACPAPVVSGATATVTCGYTGGSQYWTVPAGVTQATFTLYGAEGEGGAGGGSGAEVTGTLPVTPGSVLEVNAGQAAGPFGGGSGGGGGASDIRDGGYTLADRLLVAGGGGGGGLNGGGLGPGGGTSVTVAGGAGGNAGSPGGTGASAVGSCLETEVGGGGGGAGTATMGGAGGAGNTSGAGCGGNTTPPNGGAGSEGSGGASGESLEGTGGGGGGGYYGGGGGAAGAWDQDGDTVSGSGGGGGGSSYTGTATGASVNDDPASPPPGGNGEVIITYQPVLSVTNHSLSGQETAVSCLTASRCVAVGSRGAHAVVVTLANGAQSHAAVLARAAVIGSVSCPSASGCWAIGRPDRGAGAYLVKLSSAGRPAAERTLALPAGTSLDAISCASMTSCQVAGTDNRTHPGAVETGTWNGSRLHLYRVRVSGTQVSVTGISCWHSDCEAVGSALAGSAATDFIVTTSGGKPGTLNANSGYALSSISCVSATTCYAAGAAVLVTVTSGVPADAQAVAGGWNGNAIECTGSDCEAAGGEVFGATYADVLVSLSGGTAGSPVIVQTGQGYSGIAARGSGFIAIGASTSSGSQDTVG